MLCSKDFYKPSKYNHETKEQMWSSAIGDMHESFCGCEFPFAHFLSSIFPPGHQDRDKTINQILLRDYKQICHTSGDAGESHGMAFASPAAEEEGGPPENADHIKEENTIEDLLLAAAAAEGER